MKWLAHLPVRGHLPLTETKPYDGLFNDPTCMVSGYAPDEITYDSYLDLNKNTLKVASTLNHKFNAQDNFKNAII